MKRQYMITSYVCMLDRCGAEALQQREEEAGADAGESARTDILIPPEPVNIPTTWFFIVKIFSQHATEFYRCFY